MQLVFAPNGAELAATTQYIVQSALQQWLGDEIRVDDVTVVSVDHVLQITVVYTLLETLEQNRATFTRPGAAP
jgi:hypothetical protein